MTKILTPPLIIMHWDVTNACNAKCIFCLNRSGRALPNELSTDQAIGLIDDIANMGVRYLRILGGEPFYRRDIMDIIKAAISRKIQILFSTNGSLLTARIANSLSKDRSWLRYVQVSLYGTSPEDYDIICGNKNLFEHVCKGIGYLTDAGISPTIFSVINGYNKSKIDQLYMLASELGAKALRVAPVHSMGRALFANDKSLCLSQSEFYKSLKDALNICTPDVPIEIVEYPLMADYIEKKLPLKVLRISCQAALTQMYISPEGHCSPCPFICGGDNQFYSNYPKNSIEAIWNSKEFQYYRKLHDSVPLDSKHIDCPYSRTRACRPCVANTTSCMETLKNNGWLSPWSD